MINNVILIGRIVNDIEVKELEKRKVANFSLAVQRKYKNEKGEYEADFVDLVVWNELATNLKEYCKKGDLIGVEGRIQTSIYETKEAQKRKSTDVIVEKVTFLQTKKNEE